MGRRARALVLLGSLGAVPACAPDDSSIGGLFRADPGLVAEYFDARDVQRPSGQPPSGVYRDADIDFQGWQLNELVQSRGHTARSISIRWTGQIRLARAETYTLGFDLQGRVRIWTGQRHLRGPPLASRRRAVRAALRRSAARLPRRSRGRRRPGRPASDRVGDDRRRRAPRRRLRGGGRHDRPPHRGRSAPGCRPDRDTALALDALYVEVLYATDQPSTIVKVPLPAD
jgi:hypothetical protein